MIAHLSSYFHVVHLLVFPFFRTVIANFVNGVPSVHSGLPNKSAPGPREESKKGLPGLEGMHLWSNRGRGDRGWRTPRHLILMEMTTFSL